MAPATTPAWSGAVRAWSRCSRGWRSRSASSPTSCRCCCRSAWPASRWPSTGSGCAGGCWLGLLTGAAFMFVHLFWMRSVGWDAWLMLASLETAFFVPLGGACAAVSRRRGWPVWTAALWVAVEVWRSGWPFGGMPWGRLAFATADTPFGLGPALRRRDRREPAGRAGRHHRSPGRCCTSGPRPVPVVAAALGLGAGRRCCRRWRRTPRPTDGELTVAAVQGDVPGPRHRHPLRPPPGDPQPRGRHDPARPGRRGGQVPAPDLVLWPENSTALDPFRDASAQQRDQGGRGRRRRARPGRARSPTTPSRARSSTRASSGTPRPGAADRYTKRHPVPYGEYIPWRDSNPLTSRFDELARVARDMQAGTRVEPLRIAGVDRRGRDLLRRRLRRGHLHAGPRPAPGCSSCRPTTRPSAGTSQLDQQFEITRLRALETGRPRRRRLHQRHHRDHRARTARATSVLDRLHPGVRRRAGAR